MFFNIYCLSWVAEIVVVGSSIIRRSAKFCKRVGRALCLPLPLRWCGRSGLGLHNLQEQIDRRLSPKGKGFLVIHAGANSIGTCHDIEWLRQLEEVVLYTRLMYPGYRLIWSDMIRRSEWRYLPTGEAEKRRRRLQQRARELFYSEDGDVIRHLRINHDDSMLSNDNVHLNLMGQEMFSYDLWAYFSWCKLYLSSR